MTFLACCRIAYLEDAGDIRRVCSPAAARRLTKKQLRSFLKKSQFKHISSDHQNKKISITAAVKTLSLKSSAKGSKMRQASSEAIEPASAEQKIPAQVFTFREMAIATNNFSVDNLVGEGGFGRVYKGCIPGVDKIVAVKQLDKNGLQGNREFLSEVFMLSMVSHTNLVNLIGYCADGDQRILVYEYMANGCLEDHLLDLPSNKKPLDWYTRMKIAYGAAKGLEYLHEHTNPPVIYRDFKASNILLNEEFNPRLSDFGLARIGPTGEKDHVSTRVMGTYGYCAPEYAKTGQLTTKSDVYSFGVVFLELICGRRVIDTAKPTAEQNLITWAKPLFKDKKLYKQMADPLLGEKYPEKGLYQAVAVAAMCLQEEASTRPLISDVLIALEFLLVPKPTDDQGRPRGIIVKAPVEDNPDEEKKHAEEDDEETKAEEDEEKKFEDEDEDKNVKKGGQEEKAIEEDEQEEKDEEDESSRIQSKKKTI